MIARIEQKRIMLGALTLLLMLSLSSTTAGTALRKAKKVSPIDGFDSMDRAHLLRNAIKVENHHLRSRVLNEDGEGQEGENEGENNEGEQENNDQEKDNEEENDEKDEDEDAEEQNEEDEKEEEDNAEEADEENEEENDEDEAEEDNVDEENEEAEEEDKDEEEAEEEDEDEEEAENDDEEEEEEEAEEEEEEAEEEENKDQGPQINFLKCVAMTIEPEIVDVEGMYENGEIDEDEAAELEKQVITEMSSNLNTQESIIFFTFDDGEDDDEDGRQVYMIGINDWVAASSEDNDDTCNVLDEEDVETVFSKIPSYLKSPVTQYAEHNWYAGFNCKADGSGIKPQLFLDETCNTFSPALNQYYPFRRASDDYSYQVGSDLTTYMMENANDSIANAQYCEDNEFCDKILEHSVEVATCEAAVEEEEEEEEKDEDEEMDNEDRRLTSYQLEHEEASNIEDACPSIQSAFNIDEQYEYSSDDIEALVSFWSNTVNGGQEKDRRSLIPGTNDMWLLTLTLLVVLVIGSCLYLGETTKNPLYILTRKPSDDTAGTGDSKKEPLVERDIQQSTSTMSAIECTLAKKKAKKAQRKTKTMKFRQFLKKNPSKDEN
jgi:hypothetical protein